MSEKSVPGGQDNHDTNAQLAQQTAVQNKETARPPTSDSIADESDHEAEGQNEGIPRIEAGHGSKLPFSKARCIALVVTVACASFMNTFSAQAVVIILPTIGEDLSIPDSRLQWIISAFSLTFGCFLLLWGRIADIYGKRRIFVWGSAWVAVTTAANPFITNEIGFDVFRGLQGLGSAANVPTAIGILGTTFKPGMAKNYAFSAYAAAAPLGAIVGNMLGGIVAQFASWKWVFGVIAIFSGLVAIAGVLVIPPPPAPAATLRQQHGISAKNSVDWIGVFLVTVGLLALLFALTEGNVVGWSTPWIPTVLVVAVLLLALFAVWQRHLERRGKRPPLVKLSVVFGNAHFAAAMAIMGLFFSSFNGFLVYATYFYQSYQGLGPLQTTLRFLPTGVAGALTAAAVSQLLARIPTVSLLLFGNICVSVSNLLFAVVPPDANYFAWGLPAMILSVLGADTSWPCLTLFTSHALPQEDQAMGGALVNAMGQIGRAVGLAIATAVQTAVMAHERGVTVEEVGPVVVGDAASLAGLRAADWFDFATAIVSVAVIAVAFRGSGIVGKAGVGEPEEQLPERGGGEEGIMQEESTSRP